MVLHVSFEKVLSLDFSVAQFFLYSTMGPRAAGFLTGGLITASVSTALHQFDMRRKAEVTNRKIEEAGIEAESIVRRFYLVQMGLNSLSCSLGPVDTRRA